MASMMQAQIEIRRTNSKLSSGQGSARNRRVGVGDGPAADGEGPGGPANDCEGMMNILCGQKFLASMLIFIPLGFYVSYTGQSAAVRFSINFLAIVPLAWLIGKTTEDAAAAVGQTAGGVLNATFGNVVEMLLCIAGIRNNEIAVVQCTLLGSILSNLLLVLGTAFIVGGVYYPTQKFSQQGANTQCSLMAMSVLTIGLPTCYAVILKQDFEQDNMVKTSRVVSIFLLITYAAYLFFQLGTHKSLFEDESEEEEDPPDLTPVTATVLLAICTVVTSFSTDNLISAIEGTVDSWQLSKEFIGIILLPIIGNAAEHYTAITVAARNKMDLSLGVAVGSSCQMALLVTPFTICIGWIYGTDMTLDFHSFQLAVLFLAVFLACSVLNNGECNYLEGIMLVVVYLIIGLIYFYEGNYDSGLSVIDLGTQLKSAAAAATGAPSPFPSPISTGAPSASPSGGGGGGK